MNKVRLSDSGVSILIMFLLMGPCAYAQEVFYVATTGRDANPGTFECPFRTLQKGVDVATPGDTILVRDGTYGPEGSGHRSWPVSIDKAGTPEAWITLKSENKWGAVLDCQLTAHAYINFQPRSAYWRIEDFDIRNGYWGGIWSNEGGCKHVLISGNQIHHIGNRKDYSQIGIAGIYTDAGAQDVTVEGNVIHDVGRTNYHTNSFDHGIYSHGNLSIINNIFYRSLNGWHVQTAIHFSGIIANNTFYGPNMYESSDGAVKKGQIELWDPADGDVIIRNNIFYNPNGQAIDSFQFAQANGTCSCDHNILFGAGVVLGAPSPCTTANNHFDTDPLFVDAATYDFRLQAGSPARDAGAPLTISTKDFDGVSRPQCGGYDIGAFEYDCSGAK